MRNACLCVHRPSLLECRLQVLERTDLHLAVQQLSNEAGSTYYIAATQCCPGGP